MESSKHDYLYTSVVSDDCKENDFFVEFFSYETDGLLSNPAAVTKNFDELLEFLEQFEE
jgi:hypothetical protein